MNITMTTSASQVLQTPGKTANFKAGSTANTPSKQLPAINQYNVKQTAQMLSDMAKFAQEMGVDLLIAFRNTHTDNVTTLSTDPSSFSLKDAARSKLVKNLAMNDEKESLQAVKSVVSDRNKHLLESATTQSSNFSEANTTSHDKSDYATSPTLSADIKAGQVRKIVTEVNFASLMCSDDDDDEINQRDNQSAVADHACEPLVAPRLHRMITETGDNTKQDLQLAKISSVESAHSANELMRSSEDLEQDEHDQAKYLAHTRFAAKHTQFTDPINSQGRNLFAQKHLFKSRFQGEKLPEIFDSDEEECSFEADLTDPVSREYSNVESARSAMDDSLEPSNYGGEDEDQLDFMFLACADWEKIVEDEQAQEQEEPKSASGPRVSSFGAVNQLKREVKADLKENTCGSFANYCKESASDDNMSSASRTVLDIDSMMKKVHPHRLKKRSSKRSAPEQTTTIGAKRPSQVKTPQQQGFKRPGQFSNAAALFARAAQAKPKF